MKGKFIDTKKDIDIKESERLPVSNLEGIVLNMTLRSQAIGGSFSKAICEIAAFAMAILLS